jgi:hypothetical protein
VLSLAPGARNPSFTTPLRVKHPFHFRDVINSAETTHFFTVSFVLEKVIFLSVMLNKRSCSLCYTSTVILPANCWLPLPVGSFILLT